MYRDRNAVIKERNAENKRLQQETKRMEQELQKIKRIKKMQNDRLLMQKELQLLNIEQKSLNERQNDKQVNLTSYAKDIVKKQQKIKKNVEKIKNTKMMVVDSSSSQGQQEGDGENLKYFLEVMGMGNHFNILQQNKVLSLTKLKTLKQPDLKKMNIPIKDQIKINKKLRSMGL